LGLPPARTRSVRGCCRWRQRGAFRQRAEIDSSSTPARVRSENIVVRRAYTRAYRGRRVFARVCLYAHCPSTVRTRAYGCAIMCTHRRTDAHRNLHDCVNTGIRSRSIMYAASTTASRYPYTSVHYCDSSLRQYWPKGFHCDCLPRTYTYTALGPAHTRYQPSLPRRSTASTTPFPSPLPPPSHPFLSLSLSLSLPLSSLFLYYTLHLLHQCRSSHRLLSFTRTNASFKRNENGHIRFHDSLK